MSSGNDNRKVPFERVRVRIILSLLVTAFLASMAMDIWGLWNGNPLKGISAWTEWLTVFLAALLVLVSGRDAREKSDRFLALIAFAAVLTGDTLFALNHSLFGGNGPVFIPFTALMSFLACHLAFIVRHGRDLVFRFEPRDKGFSIIFPAGFLAAAILSIPILMFTGAFLITVVKLSLLMTAFLIYCLVLFTSFGFAWAAGKSGYFGRTAAGLIAAGLTLFVLCDLTVAITDAGITPYSDFLHILLWVFYTPALTLLALSVWNWEK